MKEAWFLYGSTVVGASDFSSDILWRTSFKAPEPFPLVEIDGESFLLASLLEVERAEKEAKVNKVVSVWDYQARTNEQTPEAAVKLFLKEMGITTVVVPPSISYRIGKFLEGDFEVKIKETIVYPERAKKTEWEISEIEKAQRAVESVVVEAVNFLSDCKIKGTGIFYKKNIVTSEMIRDIIDSRLYHRGYLSTDIIVAGGIQSADPHCLGLGPLKARSPIVIDVFPYSRETHYFADMTRTFFKGEPSDELKKMYETVLEAQNFSIGMIRADVDGFEIQKWVMGFFESRGYSLDPSKRPIEGFSHSVGHGVGIDMHESPRITRGSYILEERNVVTVEPGLYYSSARGHIPVGGIRIEDLVVVEKNGCRNLTKFPKDIKSVIIP